MCSFCFVLSCPPLVISCLRPGVSADFALCLLCRHLIAIFIFPPELSLYHTRALSLRNMVSGIFPAGVGSGSPSRDAANWLPSRLSLSVETRRRYGWLRASWCSQVRAFSELQFGALREVRRHARGREHCRRGEPGSFLSGRYAPDSAKVEGSSIVNETGEC